MLVLKGVSGLDRLLGELCLLLLPLVLGTSVFTPRPRRSLLSARAISPTGGNPSKYGLPVLGLPESLGLPPSIFGVAHPDAREDAVDLIEAGPPSSESDPEPDPLA